MTRLNIIDRLADEAVTVVAIVSLLALGLTGNVEPTTATAAISGLGGYRLHKSRTNATAVNSPANARTDASQGGE